MGKKNRNVMQKQEGGHVEEASSTEVNIWQCVMPCLKNNRLKQITGTMSKEPN